MQGTPEKIYAVEHIPGKGRGVVALTDITKGTRVMSEKPIITISQNITSIQQLRTCILDQVSSLSKYDRQEFFSMANVYGGINPLETWYGILRTNALPMGPNLDTGGIFLQACRINHACDGNAVHCWNENLNQLTIHAIRDIRKGEEITISYLATLRNRQARQDELLHNFGFLCACQLCCLPLGESKCNDAALDRIHAIDDIIEKRGIKGLVKPAQKMLSYVDEQVRIWKKTTIAEGGLTRAYPDAFQIAVANGDLARARVFAERCLRLYETSLGNDSPDVAEYGAFVVNPATHKYYGMSTKWATTVDEIPYSLDTQSFEDWLWRR
ncbi:SET domain-containing protein [Paraphaeosphaeria sporulosa]|uniref:SET domain-containing protein n=1 Tax=Paraphaeosphaeria sporulosa TaxID=1460663 RepID=A0A177BW32_9PLEO|nr:SET domain-containing protein [Paraphaeosphaeria sporulosa]OAF98576.1 SET domain-containing protein [Paraphaeosphaeria sporulosa]